MNWQVNRTILRIYHRLIGKWCFIHGTARDPLLSPFCESRVARVVSRLESMPDFLLFISDYSIPDAIAGKMRYAAYFDSFLDLQMRYFDDNREEQGVLGADECDLHAERMDAAVSSE